MLLPVMMMATLAHPAAPKLVFEQDFAKLKDIDESVWTFDDGPVYNNEQQRYTRKPAKNAWIEGGRLIIEARKGSDGKITSGRLTSKECWKYGTFEVVCKVPLGRGTWPAAWMLNDRIRSDKHGSRLGWPKCGEIDLMENVGYEPQEFVFSLHSQKYNHTRGNARSHRVKVSETLPTFHTYRMEWDKNGIRMTMDGKEVFAAQKTEDTLDAWPFDDPYYFILNLAIGGDWGGAKGVDPSIFPARFEIKSIRVWQ